MKEMVIIDRVKVRAYRGRDFALVFPIIDHAWLGGSLRGRSRDRLLGILIIQPREKEWREIATQTQTDEGHKGRRRKRASPGQSSPEKGNQVTRRTLRFLESTSSLDLCLSLPFSFDSLPLSFDALASLL